MTELYKAFYWKGGPHPQDEVYLNFQHIEGWYWLSRGHDGKINLATREKYNHITGRFTRPTQSEAIRMARSDAHSAYWAAIWRAAYANMPHRIAHSKDWCECEPGTTKLTDFIRGEVRGKYKMVDNRVQKLVLREYKYGQKCALARCMGFILKKDGRTPNHNWVHNSLSNGARPRDPAKRERLLELAGKHGKQKAYEILTKLGVRNWYV